MASRARRLPANADGEFFVDDGCIDCGACRWIAPATFGPHRGLSRVHRQPATAEEHARALKALIACPVAAIGTASRQDPPPDPGIFPDRIAGDVYYCGYHSPASYGAASWLIVRPQGNVLIDSPRFARPLADQIAALGGIKWMFLTHRDDVADHAKFRARFGCERVMHAADLGWNIGAVERPIEGRDPALLDDDLLLIPVPGHTRGSTVLLYRDRFLFTGDHMWFDRADGTIGASRAVCWYDWDELVASMARLAAYRFEWVLPGHGDPGHLPADKMRAAIRSWVAAARKAA